MEVQASSPDGSGKVLLELRDRDTDMRVIELSLGARTD
jgi:hypothetical protein